MVAASGRCRLVQLIWRTRGRERQAYNFSYDYLDRLTSAVYADVSDAGTVTLSKNFNESLTYADARGNISNLKRQGPLAAGGCTYGQIDNLSYTYYTGMNRLKTITDGSTPMGFKPLAGATDYLYDANGNMYSDPHKGLTITYNHLNLPKTFNFGGGKVIDILYDAAGNKLRKTIIGSASNYTQEYIGGIEYRGTVREAIYTAEGRYNSGTSRYEYTIKDHLGNARISFTDVNANGSVDFATEVLQENHYYPFGLNFDGNWKNDAARDNKYQYNGKEINDDFGLNWYNYGKRWYDAAIGRFPTVDPIASDFAFVTPYNYAENEPVVHIDLWGLQSFSINNLAYSYLNKVGNAMHSQGKHEVDKRVPLFQNGAKNTFFGVVGTAGAIIGAPETGLGSLAALPFTATEVGIGVTQMGDALFSSNVESNSPLHKSSSILGLAAHSSGAENAELIDALGGVIPGAFGGGNVFGSIDDAVDAIKLVNAGDYSTAAFKVASVTDGVLDVKAVGSATMTVLKPMISSGKATSGSVNNSKPQTEKLTSSEVESIKNFINKQ